LNDKSDRKINYWFQSLPLTPSPKGGSLTPTPSLVGRRVDGKIPLVKVDEFLVDW